VTFQRVLDCVIGTEMLPRAFAYQDDIIMIGRSLEEQANLRLSPEKCKFFRKELTSEGIGTGQEKVAAIA